MLLDQLDTSTILILFPVVLLLVWLVRTLINRQSLPPGPFPLPIFGNLLTIAKAQSNQLELFKSLSEKYGKIFTLSLGAPKFIVINDLNLVQKAFVKNGHVFSDRPTENLHSLKILAKDIGVGLILSNAVTAKEIRKFSLTAMKGFGVGKRSLEERITEEMHVILEELNKLEQQPYQIKGLMNKATSNIICSIIFNTRFSYDDPTFIKLLNHLDRSSKVNPLLIPVNFFPVLRFWPSVKKRLDEFVEVFKSTDEYVKHLTQENDKTYDPLNIRDFVDLTIQMRLANKGNHNFDEVRMRHVIVDLFAGGSDTTAVILTWAVLYMAAYPDVQSKCQQEIDQVLGRNRNVTLTDKVNLKFVEATLLEVLRLRPVAPLSPPHCPTKDTELLGYSIPKSALVMANLHAIHNDASIWSNPEKFMPEHFLDNEGSIVNQEKIIPFSVGPRACIGEHLAKMEMFIFFTSILQFFTVKPVSGQTVDLTPFIGLVYQPCPQDLVFEKR